MLKSVLMAVAALTVAGAGYTTVLACGVSPDEACGAADQTVVLADSAATAPATEKAAGVDVKNAKCIVMTDDDASEKTVEYKGKKYHVCCNQCVKAFNKNPEKYVKAYEASIAAATKGETK